MRYSALAERYARALFEISPNREHQDQIFAELRALQQIFVKDRAIFEFMCSPVIKAEDKEAAVGKALNDVGLAPDTKAFMQLLAQKNRLAIFDEIVEAMQVLSDQSHGVTRGNVRSAAILGPDDRKQIEEIVGRFTKKQVILRYKEDPALIGGLIAEVGSHSFDDTLTSHLRRLKEEITRRAQ